MQSFICVIRVKRKHTDGGGHANWRAQEEWFEDFHYKCRNELGFGLKKLKSMSLYFVMSEVTSKFYIELYKGDEVTLHLTVNQYSPTRLIYTGVIYTANREKAMEMTWYMPLVPKTWKSIFSCMISWITSLFSKEQVVKVIRVTKKVRPVKLPPFIVEAIETKNELRQS